MGDDETIYIDCSPVNEYGETETEKDDRLKKFGGTGPVRQPSAAEPIRGYRGIYCCQFSRISLPWISASLACS